MIWSKHFSQSKAKRKRLWISVSHSNCIQWQAISLTVIEKVQIAAIILGSLFLIASVSWLVWSSLSPSAKWQRQDLLFQICYGMYGFMDIVCIGKNTFHQYFSNLITFVIRWVPIAIFDCHLEDVDKKRQMDTTRIKNKKAFTNGQKEITFWLKVFFFASFNTDLILIRGNWNNLDHISTGKHYNNVTHQMFPVWPRPTINLCDWLESTLIWCNIPDILRHWKKHIWFTPFFTDFQKITLDLFHKRMETRLKCAFVFFQT